MTATEQTPLIEELIPAPKPEDTFSRFARLPHCLFLDSAMRHPILGRYSFLAADPFDHFSLTLDGVDALEALGQRMDRFHANRVCGIPPFQGGAAGLFSYDLGRQLETVPAPSIDEFHAPVLDVGFYDVVLAWDHATERCWLVSQGFPENSPIARERRAQERMDQFWKHLRNPLDDNLPRCPTRPEVVLPEDLAPQYPLDGPTGLTSNFSEEQYLEMIARAIEYVHAGDVFQVNMAQRLLFPAWDDAVSLYLRLRRRNPATFAGYFDLGDFQIASASPERFLRVVDRSVETRPIKGTQRRTLRLDVDRAAAEALLQSEKDRAENIMIVDLLRNDLSRVCLPSSVKVSQLCDLETYQYVMHLVSSVEGVLADGRTPLDLVRATFPGGSITGAPKVRAMEIIAELEPTARGPYCGSLGYLGFDGSLDLNLLIRTIVVGRGWWQAPVGGGIVAQSDPRKEYEETLHKAEGLIRALRPSEVNVGAG